MFLVFVMGACDAPQSVERHDVPQTANNDVINDAVIDEYWSYQMVYDNRELKKYEARSFYGLYIEYNCIRIENGERKHQKELVKFDDEMDYNPYIAEWLLAFCVAKKLFSENQYLVRDEKGKIIVDKDGWGEYKTKRDVKELNEMLTKVRDLPNLDEDMDPEIREIFLEVYYNCKNIEIYMPKEGYGYRKYPISGYGSGWGTMTDVWLKRVKSQNGVLVITGSSHWMFN